MHSEASIPRLLLYLELLASLDRAPRTHGAFAVGLASPLNKVSRTRTMPQKKTGERAVGVNIAHRSFGDVTVDPREAVDLSFINAGEQADRFSPIVGRTCSDSLRLAIPLATIIYVASHLEAPSAWCVSTMRSHCPSQPATSRIALSLGGLGTLAKGQLADRHFSAERYRRQKAVDQSEKGC